MSRVNDTDPDDVDATFAAIVADLRAEGLGAADALGPESPSREQDTGRDSGEVASSSQSRHTGDTAWDDTVLGDDEHYVPPEPPPLPRPRKSTFVVLLFFVLGLLLLSAPGLVGLGTGLATPLGILAMAFGLALLLLRVRQGPPDGADPTNGAQV